MPHCGSRVKVGVKVNVGRGVSDGGRVGVPEGEGVRVTVVVSVGEGDGVVVSIGIGVGVGAAIRFSPPQLINKRENPDIETKSFLIIEISSRSVLRKRSAGDKVFSSFQITLSIIMRLLRRRLAMTVLFL